MKITSFELENVKKVRAVSVTPAESGLTVIGGKNGQGKTSVLDAIAWALGGEAYRPSNPQRDGSVLPPRLHVTLDNGITVDRSGKNSSLRVTDPSGRLAGQRLLDEFIEKLALDLPKFMAQSSKDKAKTLLRIIGMEDQIKRMDDEEAQLYNRRRTLGQIADQKKKHAQEMESYPDVPESPVSAGELIERQQAILLKNAENQRLRLHAQELLAKRAQLRRELDELTARVEALTAEYEKTDEEAQTAQRGAEELRDESTAELEESLRQIDETNRRVRANQDREKALAEADAMSREYADMSAQIEKLREERMKLLQGAAMPLPELTVEQGELLYRGKAWDCMSSSEQLRVSVAIVRAINPNCGFVLIDRTEMMDADTLREFGAWLEEEGLQAICTRVGTDCCQIIIEDGAAVEETHEPAAPAQWKKGVF